MSFSPVVTAALIGWIPVGLVLFALLGMQRGLAAVFILGWLLLPVASFRFPGLTSYSKITAITVAAVVATITIDRSGRAYNFRPRLSDLPMLVWCVCPAASAFSNGLDFNDAASAVVDQTLTWGIPYVLGRVYLGTPEAMSEMARWLVLGALLYVPLCLYEIKMSPQLNRMIYGFNITDFIESRRYGGWRPAVFLQHGLAVALYMSGATVAAAWLWWQRAVRYLVGVRMPLIACGLMVVVVLCRSGGAIALMAIGLAVLVFAKSTKSRGPLLALLLFAPVYVGVRSTGIWTGKALVEMAANVDKERSESLGARMDAEDALASKAWKQPVFGWSGYGRFWEVRQDTGNWAIPDGMWIITFGSKGLVGLIALIGAVLLPVAMFLYTTPKARLFSAEYAGALAVAVVVVFFMIDCLFNAMINPVYAVAMGGLASLAAATARQKDARVPRLPRRPGRASRLGSA